MAEELLATARLCCGVEPGQSYAGRSVQLQHCPASRSWVFVDWPSGTDCSRREESWHALLRVQLLTLRSSLARQGGLALRHPMASWQSWKDLGTPGRAHSCLLPIGEAATEPGHAGLVCIAASLLASTQVLCTGGCQ